MATFAPVATRDQTFWQKMALGIALFIVFGFAQFAARGMVDVPAVPAYVHFHGVLMLAWLALTVAQAWLAGRADLTMHRRLGWTGLILAALVIATGSYTGIQAIATHRQPPFFTPAYFLALTQVQLVFFAGLLVAAVAYRRQTEWHRRLMLGATVLLMEPALGRLLPMPLIMPWGQWLATAFQLVPLALVAQHDRKALGAVHPATIVAALVLVVGHLILELLAITPAWVALAKSIAGT